MNLKSVSLLSALLIAATASAAPLASWNFESLDPNHNDNPFGTTPFNDLGPIAADGGTGSLSAHHAIAAAYKSLTGNGSTESVSSQAWSVGDYYQFTTSSLGFGSLVVSFDQQGPGTGPKDFDFTYSTDGTTFTKFASYTQTTDSWASSGERKAISLKSFDLSGVSALTNQSAVYFRLVNTSTAAINGTTVDPSNTGGSSRLDNVLVSAAPVPEPASMAALGLGVAAFFRRRKA